MPSAGQIARPVKNRIVFIFYPWPERRCRGRVTYCIILAAIVISGINQIVIPVMFDDFRAFIDIVEKFLPILGRLAHNVLSNAKLLPQAPQFLLKWRLRPQSKRAPARPPPLTSAECVFPGEVPKPIILGYSFPPALRTLQSKTSAWPATLACRADRARTGLHRRWNPSEESVQRGSRSYPCRAEYLP